MNLDQGRKYDLEELDKARREAPNAFWANHYQKKMFKILEEAGGLTSLREDLILAFRANDRRAVERINREIRHIRLNQTAGKLDH